MDDYISAYSVAPYVSSVFVVYPPSGFYREGVSYSVEPIEGIHRIERRRPSIISRRRFENLYYEKILKKDKEVIHERRERPKPSDLKFLGIGRRIDMFA
jgi:hypothetical protein